MDQFHKKEVIQAVVVIDNNVDHFRPISDNISIALLPLVNVPFLDYTLESLNRSGIEEVFVYSSVFINDVKEHIKNQVNARCSWSVNMSVKVIGAEDCRCLGDALRDLDVKGLIRNHFILMGTNTVSNANLTPILNEHRKRAKFDKGTAMTVVYKEASNSFRTGDQVMIAMDAENNRLHFHQRIKPNTKEKDFIIPLEIFLNNSEMAIHHNLIDPQIAICSPSLLSLYSDNFDFENRDDFIRGLLINEEILDSRIYVSMLPIEQYARTVSNWLTYQIVSNDVINRWAYPLVPDMGICCLWQNYVFLRNNIYKNETANVSRVILKENVVIQEKSVIDSGSELSKTVVGRNCKIGKNCILNNVFLFDNVTIEDNCNLQYCIIANGSKISTKSILSDGVVIGQNVIIPQNSKLSTVLVQNSPEEAEQKKLGNHAYIVDDSEELFASDSEDEEFQPTKIGIPKMKELPFNYEDSDYDSTSEEEESRQGSPIPDDANIFLSEVIDSLTRGFNERSNPDFLILEINSSRYAYNMTLKEVNFNVVKAVFSLPKIKADSNVLSALNQVLGHLGPVITNYIKTEDSMIDCLKAVEECCNEDDDLHAKIAQIIHYLYDKEIITEDSILTWYRELPDESNAIKDSLKKLIDWLMASSEEESDD